MRRPELIRKLVTKFHLSVAERGEIGGTATQQEVVEAILGILLEEGFYPPHVRPSRPGAPAYDGTILELLPSGGCRAHGQWATALGSLAGVRIVDHRDALNAVSDLVMKDFGAEIDGVAVVLDHLPDSACNDPNDGPLAGTGIVDNMHPKGSAE